MSTTVDDENEMRIDLPGAVIDDVARISHIQYVVKDLHISPRSARRSSEFFGVGLRNTLRNGILRQLLNRVHDDTSNGDILTDDILYPFDLRLIVEFCSIPTASAGISQRSSVISSRKRQIESGMQLSDWLDGFVRKVRQNSVFRVGHWQITFNMYIHEDLLLEGATVL